MILGVDVSRYQPEVDWPLLKSKGVEFAFIKATQGNYTTDPNLEKHVQGANKAGLIVGLYHWCDPLIPYKAQAEYFCKVTKGLPYTMAAADVEQEWASWQEWAENRITQYLSPATISENGRNILAYWDDRLSARSVLYTRASFIHSYARPMLYWVKQYPLWLASYPYARGRVTMTWEEFKANHLPTTTAPLLPEGCNNWAFWQFTGDKFILPGTTTAWDLNFYNGSLTELQAFAGQPVQSEPEEEEEKPMAFETNAIGMQLDDSHTATVIPTGKVNFVAVDLGKGAARSLRATQHMETAAKAGAACIGLYELDPELCGGWDFDNEERWPKASEDPHMKVLNRQMLSGTALRGVQGIILMLRKSVQVNGTQVTAGWQYMIAQHYMKMVYQAYGGKVQVYLFADKSLVNQYPGTKKFTNYQANRQPYLFADKSLVNQYPDTNQFTNYLAHQPFVSTYQSAYLDAPQTVQVTQQEALPRPDALDKPGQPYAPAWQFWKYSNTKFTFEGVTGGPVPMWMYYKNPAALYAELAFTGAGGVDDPITPPPADPPTPPPASNDDVKVILARLEAKVDSLIQFMASIKAL